MALFLGRLTPDTRSRDLEDLFAKYGRVTRLDIKRGTNSGFGFVEYEDPRDAEEAVHKLNRHVVNGSEIVVEFAKNNGRRAGDNECFKVTGLVTAVSLAVDAMDGIAEDSDRGRDYERRGSRQDERRDASPAPRGGRSPSPAGGDRDDRDARERRSSNAEPRNRSVSPAPQDRARSITPDGR
ncbi:hypothetical protein BGZ94_001150 [Podila epigama]|nr:hypothetical protein BGZ94_001150 [Podila epigama]